MIYNKRITTDFKQFYYLFRLNAEKERTLENGYFFVGTPPKVIVRITYKAGGNYNHCFVFQYNSSNELMCTYNEYRGGSKKIDDNNGIIEQIKKLLERNINGNEERFSNTIKKLKDDFKLITEAKTSNEIKYYKVIDNNIKMNDGTEDLNHSATGLRTDDTGTDIDNDKPSLNLILYGPPGTGKTYHTVDKALERLLPKQDLDALLKDKNTEKEKREAQVEKFNSLKNEGRIVFTTFHQSMSYEDFIEGIKPITSDKGEVTYEVKPGIFKQICEKANPPQTDNFENAWGKLLENLSTKNITVKNISGNGQFIIELCQNGTSVKDTQKTAKTFSHDQLYRVYRGLPGTPGGGFDNYRKAIIEQMKNDPYNLKDYQAPMDNVNSNSGDAKINRDPYVLIIDEINRGNVANIFGELITLIEDDKRGKLSVKLPYSNEDFSVPKNLYIIGTMNTADRSVEALDTALRRRFSFEEMMPRYDLDELKNTVCGHTLETILKTINNRLRVLKDREHQIGHSYFMKVATEAQLTSVFFDKIIPLLQEYFYGDYEKIQMILGDGFVVKDADVENVTFASNNSTIDRPIVAYKIADKNTIDINNALDKLMVKTD